MPDGQTSGCISRVNVDSLRHENPRREFLARPRSVSAVPCSLRNCWSKSRPPPNRLIRMNGRARENQTQIFARRNRNRGCAGGNRQSNHTRMGKEKFETLIRESNDRGVDTRLIWRICMACILRHSGARRDSTRQVSGHQQNLVCAGGIPEQERPDADVCVERFLRELKTDFIDLLLLHCATSAKWPEELRRQMDISKLKEQGKIARLAFRVIPRSPKRITEPWVESVHNPHQPRTA